MKALSTAVLGASLWALSACGGGSETDAANNVEIANIQADDLTLPADNSLELPADSLGGEADPLGTADATDVNATGAALTADANAVGNSQ
ncbi:MAG TPA: hypothetical protein VGW34_01725 [Allosphingosinicella sp.]|nr:hypothetical protein [Allosphingosinicella sp.]